MEERLQKLETKHNPQSVWVILPNFEDVDGVQMVLNSKTQERITKEEFNKMDVPGEVMALEVDFI